MNITKGMALVEIIIGSAIISVGVLAAIISYNTYIEYALANNKNIQASYLLEEGLEVMTFFRDKGWTSNISKLSTTTPYYLLYSGGAWATTTTPQYVDTAFLRSISIADVARNGSDQISTSGTYDSGTKKITVTVAYLQGHATTTRSLSLYLANINGN